MTGSSRGATGRSEARGYRGEWLLFRTQYAKTFAFAAGLLVAACVLGFAYFAAHPERSSALLATLNSSVLAKVPRGSSGAALALAIFWNNLRASLIALALGIIPFACLPAVFPLLNGGILGLLMFALHSRGMNVPLRFLVDLAPHGVFEIAGWLYATTLGMRLSLDLVRRLLAPRPAAAAAGSAPSPEQAGPEISEGARPETPLLRQIVVSFLRVVVPLLLVAALVEAYVTPLLDRAVFG